MNNFLKMNIFASKMKTFESKTQIFPDSGLWKYFQDSGMLEIDSTHKITLREVIFRKTFRVAKITKVHFFAPPYLFPIELQTTLHNQTKIFALLLYFNKNVQTIIQ